MAGDLDGVCVRATMVGGPDNGFSRTAVTDTAGDYSILGLDGGEYRVRFGGDCGPNSSFAGEYWDDATDPGDADLVTVTEGLETQDVDAGLGGAPGAVSGTVTDWTTGNPVQDICVRTVSPSTSSAVHTSSSGTYTIPNVTAGSSWVVEFSDCRTSPPTPYTTQFYDTTTSQAEAEEIDVYPGQTHGSINARMFRAATLSGTVTDPNGNARTPACVDVHVADGHSVYTAHTDANGDWSAQMPPGNYELEVHSCGTGGLSFETRWYLDATDQTNAQEIFVDQGDAETGLDQVTPGVPGSDGRITGTVTDDLLPPGALDGICVTAYGSSNPVETTTEADGSYQLDVPPGDWAVEFSQCDHHAPYNVQTTQWDGGADVTVLPGTITGSIDVQMAPGGGIEGLVTNDAGDPLDDICVSAFTDPDNPSTSEVASDNTNADGEFRIVGLTTDDYFVAYEDCTYEYVGEWYDDVPFTSRWLSPPDGDPLVIPVTVGSDAVLDTTALARFGTITGIVTNESGDPLEGICVFGENPDSDYAAPWYDITGPDGTYLVGGLLTTTDASNEYRVRFSQCVSPQPEPEDYGEEYWDNRLSDATADPIAVVFGEDTPNIDAVMQDQAPVDTATPELRGQASVGMTLKATNGTWEHEPSEFGFEWYQCDADGVSNCSLVNSGDRYYEVAPEDEGHTIKVEVTASNSVGDATAQSDPSAVADDAAPVNDDIQDRVVFGPALPLDYFDSNVRATRQAGEPAHLGITQGSSVWYEWTAPSGGAAIDALSIDLAGSTFWPTLSVYTGTPVPLTGLTLVAQDEGAALGFDSTRVVFEPDPGETYYIAVDGYWDPGIPGAETGAIEMRLAVASGPPAR